MSQLQPGARATDLITTSSWPNGSGGHEDRPVVIVSYLPTLGRRAALLLAESEADWATELLAASSPELAG